MRAVFFIFGLIGMVAALGMLLIKEPQYVLSAWPGGFMQKEFFAYPYAVTAAGFAVFSGLCFVSVALLDAKDRDRPSASQ